MKKPEEQLTFADLDLPKKRGRPRKPDSEKLTRAEINRRYREKKKREGVQLIQVSRSEAELAKFAVEVAGLDALAARIAGKFDDLPAEPACPIRRKVLRDAGARPGRVRRHRDDPPIELEDEEDAD